MDVQQTAILIPFRGSLWTTSQELVALQIAGSFISPVGTTSDRWRGTCRLLVGGLRPIAPGDSLVLKREDGGEIDIVVMDTGPLAIGFRCVRTTSPVNLASTAEQHA